MNEDIMVLTKPSEIMDLPIGKTKKLNSLNKLEIPFLIISIASIFTTMGITIDRLAVAVSSNKTCNITSPQSIETTSSPKEINVDFTFALLLLINTVFCFFYIFYGVFRERASSLCIFVIACLIVMFYCIADYVINVCGRSTTKLVRLIIICNLGPINIILGIINARIYCVSKRLIYRSVGGLITLQNICKLLFFCEDLLYLDLQLEISMIILYLHGTQVSQDGQLVLGLGTTFSIIWIIIGICGIAYENKAAIWFFLITSVLEPAYIIFKIYDAAEDSQVLKTYVFIGSSIALIERILLIIVMVFVFRNFGKGLKGKAYSCVRSTEKEILAKA